MKNMEGSWLILRKIIIKLLQRTLSGNGSATWGGGSGSGCTIRRWRWWKRRFHPRVESPLFTVEISPTTTTGNPHVVLQPASRWLHWPLSNRITGTAFVFFCSSFPLLSCILRTTAFFDWPKNHREKSRSITVDVTSRTEGGRKVKREWRRKRRK